MDSRIAVTAADSRDDPNELVEEYLSALRRRLNGPSKPRDAAIEEIRAGLYDAIAASASPSTPEVVAAQRAISQLGTPRLVAAAFAGELAIVRARHILWALVLTGPLVGIWWFLLLTSTLPSIQPAAVVAAIPVLPAVGIVVAIAALILASTGSLIRWLPETSPRRAVLLAGVVGLVVIGVDSVMLATLTVRWLTGSLGAAIPAMAMLAGVASTVRLPFAAMATWRCTRSWRLLTTDAAAIS